VYSLANKHGYSRSGSNGSAYGCAWLYCQNDNQYQTILTIPCSIYEITELSLTFYQAAISDFEFNFRLKQSTQTENILVNRSVDGNDSNMKMATFNFS